MYNWIERLFRSEDQSHELSTPVNASAHFVLTYKDLIIGNLTHENGKWIFQYSDEFKNQEKVGVLIDFPKKDKIYKESYLWPFFSHRIPGLGQPQIQHIIQREKIDSTNEIDLLRRFGKKTITNPFELAYN